MNISAYLLLTLPVHFQRQMYILLDLDNMGSWDMVLLFLKLQYQSLWNTWGGIKYVTLHVGKIILL